MGEFDLIARIRARASTRGDVILGIGDDAALLQPPAGLQLVVAMDTLNSGVHFPPDTAPADIGWKSLAVNLSDLAAMGAAPAWCTLSLSLPDANASFVDGFLDGFIALAQQHDAALVQEDRTGRDLGVQVQHEAAGRTDQALGLAFAEQAGGQRPATAGTEAEVLGAGHLQRIIGDRPAFPGVTWPQDADIPRSS